MRHNVMRHHETMRQAANRMIIADMRKAGFNAMLNLNDNPIVGLLRNVGLEEVRAAMETAGYEPCQYTLARTVDSTMIEVVPVVG